MSDDAERSVDILVVGAGPAGCSAALAAARAGASVLLVDAKRELGLPVRCAEFVPRLMAREVEIPEEAVAQAVDEMVVFVREKDEVAELGRVRSPGFILHRERFEQNLAKLAAVAGAELLMETRATPGARGVVELGARRVRPKVTVAADGPLSAWGRPAGRDEQAVAGGHAAREGRPTGAPRGASPFPCLPAVQFTVRLARPMSWTEVHFARCCRYGYAWLFPKGDVANVGLGCAPAGGRREILPLLEAFVEELQQEGKLADGRPVRRTAGWIPVWGPPESAVVRANGGNILFAGDAGGFADPLTGTGIWPAVATGRLAGECAARAAREGDASLLSTYDDEWRSLFGAALERSAAGRRRMEVEWDTADLGCLVRNVWPGL